MSGPYDHLEPGKGTRIDMDDKVIVITDPQPSSTESNNSQVARRGSELNIFLDRSGEIERVTYSPGESTPSPISIPTPPSGRDGSDWWRGLVAILIQEATN
jgi:hypothetical protein